MNNFVFNGITISKWKAVPWAQFEHLCMQTFLWKYLKDCTFIPTSDIFQHFTVDLYMIYFSYGMKRN